MGLEKSGTPLAFAQPARSAPHQYVVALPPRELHSLLGHYARLLVDIQKVRIAVINRQEAFSRDGLNSQWGLVHADVAAVLLSQEKAVTRQLRSLAKHHFMADWVKDCPGLGFEGFAAIVGVTGSFDNFPTVSKVWKYLGLHTEDGAAPRRAKGVKLNYSPRGRSLCYQIAGSIVRLNRGRYRELYNQKKAYYEDTRPDWPQKRRHLAAMRYAVKGLIKDMWVEWTRRRSAA